MATEHPLRRKTDRGVRRVLPERFPERFYRDVWLFMITVIVVLGLLFGYQGNNNRLDDIQAERQRNTLGACEATNRQNQAIVAFVTASIPKGRRDDPDIVAYLDRARVSFPVQDCELVVKRLVQNP